MFANLRPVSSIHDPPYLAIAPQIRHLSLGPYSTRTLPLSSLQHFACLESLTIPLRLFLQDELTNLSPSLTAIRLTSAVSKTDRDSRRENWRELRKNWRDGCEKICRILSGKDGRLEEPVERFERTKGRGDSLLDLLYGPLEGEDFVIFGKDEIEKDWTLGAAVEEEAVDGKLCIQYRSETEYDREKGRDGLWELGQENWREREGRRGFLT